jgi:hypothetical protein
MEYKQLMDTSNVVIAAMTKALQNMGLSSPLIISQVADFLNGEVKGLVDSTGIAVEGTDVKSVAESFVTEMKKLGATQRVELVSTGDSEVVIDLGECVFAPATKAIRGTDRTMIPPCPFMAVLTAALNAGTGAHFGVTKCEWKPEQNTSIFTLTAE